MRSMPDGTPQFLRIRVERRDAANERAFEEARGAGTFFKTNV